LKVVTSKEMQNIERRTISGFGIPSLVLMERAGLAVAARVKERAPGMKVLVLAGTGNNGGDGLVAARELVNAGFSVKVLITGSRARLSEDCRTQFGIARKMGIPMDFGKKIPKKDLHGALLVDAVFGTGLARPVTGELARTFRGVNGSSAPVVAVDMPSGVSSDTGQVLGAALDAEATVTFGAPKRGHFLYPGAGYAGMLHVADIGFPLELFRSVPANTLEQGEMALLVPARHRYSHKGDYGHVLLLGGSPGKTGAALMAGRAALRAGAGLVTLGVPRALAESLQGRVTEEMTLPLPDTPQGGIAPEAQETVLEFLDTRGRVLALGPGMGIERETGRLVRELLLRVAAPVVLDADALNALEGKTSLLRRARAPVVLTPHPGEFSRLTGESVAQIEADRMSSALRFARKTGTYVVLKGAPTVVASPEGEVFLNTTGNPGLAKGGAGDVLTGMIAAFLAQGLPPLEAALLGVYTHGLAADLAREETTEHSMLASDVTGSVARAFKLMAEACQ
jgi:NAD(P)H-hydrate epimerase